MTHKQKHHSISHTFSAVAYFLRQYWLASGCVLFYCIVLAALILWPGTPPLERLRWLHSGLCAQVPAHTFFSGDQFLLLCARETGIYTGFLLTIVGLFLGGKGRSQQIPSWPISILLGCGVLFCAIDGLHSFLLDLGISYLYTPHNGLRLASGLLTGMALAAFLLPLQNRLFWCEFNEQKSISSGTNFVALLAVLLLAWLAISTQSPWAFYPVGLLSTAGILLALSTMNLILMNVISKREGSFLHYREIIPFLALALTGALGEMFLLAQLREMITVLSGPLI